MADALKFEIYSEYWEARMIEDGYLEQTGEREFRQLREWTSDDNRAITLEWLKAHAAEREKADAHPNAPTCTDCGRVIAPGEPHIEVPPASFEGREMDGESIFHCAACATAEARADDA
jgi:hypothetical protein